MGFGEVRSKRGTFAMMCHPDSLPDPGKGPAARRTVLRPVPQAPLIHLRRDGDLVRLSLEERHLSDPDHFLAESLLVIWHRLASWLIGQRIRLEEATFSYPAPDHQAEYDLLFPAPAVFRRLHQPAVRRPLPGHAAAAGRTHPQAVPPALSRRPAGAPDGGDSLTSQIRRLLGRDCRRWPDLDQVARQLHMSSQTLRRHLREEGGSFQQLKDHLRRDLAIYHLGRDELSIQDIAERSAFPSPRPSIARSRSGPASPRRVPAPGGSLKLSPAPGDEARCAVGRAPWRTAAADRPRSPGRNPPRGAPGDRGFPGSRRTRPRSPRPGGGRSG